jgi:type II restriction/modification system DNA methylase subunit YeeA
VLEKFAHRLTEVTVLDPACGSGNFLYVALHLLLCLEKEVRNYAADRDLTLRQAVLPTQLLGLEKNDYAQQLAQEVIWIGYLQWIVTNGDLYERRPILDPLDTIRRQDAILDLSDPSNPKEPDWPAAEFIVGNPPFLGDKKMRGELGDEYVIALRELFSDRLPGQSDLCCYWFEKARDMIEKGRSKRAGLLATQGVRGGANRTCLDRIKETGDIFFAYGDRDWILEGATVHVSLAGFDDGSEEQRLLDGNGVKVINADLTSAADSTKAQPIRANADLSFIGASMHGPFPVDESVATRFLSTPNVHGKPNSDLVRTWANALTITKREPELWIVDVPPDVSEDDAALYEDPFEYLKSNVLPVRKNNRRPMRRKNWWILGDPQKAMRSALQIMSRFILTPRVSKHRIFVWAKLPLLATDATVAFARDDDYFFGVIHSRVHELWARSIGTQLREAESGFRYGPSTCFETFPFPEAPPPSPKLTPSPPPRRSWTTCAPTG